MAYPATGQPKAEILINGVWTDITSRVRQDSAIAITRGTASAQARLTAQVAQFSLNNRDGLFTNDNPNSTYYGLLPRNTQTRITAGSGDAFVRYPLDYSNSTSNRASTPDLAALDVVGDLELRMDISPSSWRPRASQTLISKWNFAGNQRSFTMMLTNRGRLQLFWTTDGTGSTQKFAESTVSIPAYPARQCIRVILDVINGPNQTIDFSTSSTGIDGTYTALGGQLFFVGSTSIFSSSAALIIGQAEDQAGAGFSGADGLRGKVHKARVYNGIGGTVVANPDFTTQTYGATSFTDSATRVWAINGAARITSDRLRFWGELTSPPVQTDVSGRDVYCQCVASGLIRRLTQGANVLDGSLKNDLRSRSLTGGWMLEDGSLATQAASFVTGVKPAQVTAINFASEFTLPGVVQAATFASQSGKIVAQPNVISSNTGTAYFTFYLKIATLPASLSTLVTLTSTGTARKITMGVSNTTIDCNFYAADGTVLSTSSNSFGVGTSPLGQWLGFNFLMTTSGSNVAWSARWLAVPTQSFVGIGPTTYAGSVGRITNVLVSAATSANYAGTAISGIHTATNDLNFVSNVVAQSANAYFGERAGPRMQRLGTAQGVTVEVNGDPANTEAMGYQTIDSFINQFYDCVDADGGIAGEARDALALTYRTRYDIAHRLDAIINYNTAYHLSQPPLATYDDLGIVNDVTVTRTKGSSGNRQILTGPMSISAPPTGIGRYDTGLTRNVSSDTRLPDIASWIANQGSTPGARYPNISVGMHRSIIVNDSVLTGQLASLELGDTFVLTALPSWLPPDDIYLLVRGYSENLGHFTWGITFNTTPASGLNVGRYDYTTETGQSRYGHASSTLSAGITTSATTIIVALNSTTPFTLDSWTTNSASYPFDIVIGSAGISGERITLTQAPTGTDPQTFANVTRSVNGIVKAHVAGERVQLFRPAYYGLSY